MGEGDDATHDVRTCRKGSGGIVATQMETGDAHWMCCAPGSVGDLMLMDAREAICRIVEVVLMRSAERALHQEGVAIDGADACRGHADEVS